MKNFIKLVSLIIIFIPFYVNSKAIYITEEKIQQPEKEIEQMQINMLTLSVRSAWEDNIENVGQAVQYILEPTEYHLIVDYPAPKDALEIASKSIPAFARVNRTMPIVDVIQILIGLDNTIVIDHKHKLISFQKGSIK